MKNIAIALCAVLLFGSALFGCKEEDQMGLYGIETAAVGVGYFAAQQPDVDLALRSIYDLATKGQLTAEGVNQILLRLDSTDPFELLMVRRVLRLAEIAGAEVVGGQITDIANIPSSVINAIARGYVEGYDTFMLSQAK